MTPHQLNMQLWTCQQKLQPCQCGSKVLLRYEPGCTYIHCLAEAKTVMSMPDWAPTEITKEWNQGGQRP